MRAHRSLPWVATAMLLVVSVLASEDSTESTSPNVNPTTFPFQQCVQTPIENRWSVAWHNYTEDAYNGSLLCFDLVEKPLINVTTGLASCKSNKRCCATGVNKFKWYPAAACQRMVQDITWKGVSTGAVAYEDVGLPTFIGKIVNLNIVTQGPLGGVQGPLCFQLRGTKDNGTCPIFSTWMALPAQEADVMPVALYDRKTDNYECCPVTQVPDPLKLTRPHPPPGAALSPAPSTPHMPPAYPPMPPPPKAAAKPSPPPPLIKVTSPSPPPPPPPPTKASPSPPPPPPPPSTTTTTPASPPPPPPPKSSPPPPPPPPPPVKASPSPPPPTPPPPPPPPPPVVATTSVYRNSGSIYTFVLQSGVNFSRSEAVCAMLAPGGHLLSITTMGEMYNVGTFQRTKVKALPSQMVNGTIALWMGLRSDGAAAATSWTDGSPYSFGTSFTSTRLPGGAWPPAGNTCASMQCNPSASGPGSCNWVVSSCDAQVSGYICEVSA